MLCLSAKENETITAGELTIQVCRIGRNQVRLGFSGPREIPVVRFDAKVREPKQAASAVEAAA